MMIRAIMSDSVKPWDMLNPKEERVSDDEQAARMAICHSCEFLFKPTVQCKKCGCFMELKTKLKRAFCPIEKWK